MAVAAQSLTSKIVAVAPWFSSLFVLGVAGCTGPPSTTDYTNADVQSLRHAVRSVESGSFHNAIAAVWDDTSRPTGVQRRPFAVAYTSGQPSRRDAENAVTQRCAELSGAACRLVFADGDPVGWETSLRSLFGRVRDPQARHAIAEIDTRSYEQRSAFSVWETRVHDARIRQEAEQARARAADEAEMAMRRAADDAYNQAPQERETRAAARQAALQPAPPRSEPGYELPTVEQTQRAGPAVFPRVGGYHGGGGSYRGYGGGGCGSRGGPGYRLPSGRCASWR